MISMCCHLTCTSKSESFGRKRILSRNKQQEPQLLMQIFILTISVSETKVTFGDLFSNNSNIREMLVEVARLSPEVIEDILKLDIDQVQV